MAKNQRFYGISDLEREFELDMDSEPPDEEAFDADLDEGLETELDDELEADLDEELDEDANENYADEESLDDLDQEFELMGEALDGDRDPREMELAERFHDLAQREFEAEFEVDRELGGVLDDMEREYFFGRLARGIRRVGKSKLVRGLVRKGLRFAKRRFPALKAITQLARGNLKGLLLPLAKTALGAAVPGGPAALAVLKGLGFEAAEDDPRNRVGWQNYTRMAREAYEALADNVTMRVDEPGEAGRLAASAFQGALRRAQARAARLDSGPVRGRGAGAAGDRVIRIRLRPGQTLVVTRGRR
jgi:hypothetical protein